MPGTGSKPHGHIVPYATFNVNYDYKVRWNAVDANGFPTATNAYFDQIAVADVRQYTTQQWQMLQTYFGWYQQFRCKRYTLEWIPRFRDNSGVTCEVINQIHQQQAPIHNIPSDIDSNFFAENTEITLVPDMDDTVVRSNNLDEYYLVRSQPYARTGPVKSPIKLTFDPHIFDVTAGAIAGTETADPQNATAASGSANYAPANSNPSLTGAIIEEAVTPIKNPWRATKIGISLGTNVDQLNLYECMFGYKFYFYTPFNTVTAAAGTSITGSVGLMRCHVEWEFKMPEYKFFPAVVSLNTTEENEKQLTLLRKVHGETYLLNQAKKPPEFSHTPIRQAQRASAENAGHTLDEPNAKRTRKEDYQEVIATAKQANPSPAPTSHQTPAGPKARFPLGLNGSR